MRRIKQFLPFIVFTALAANLPAEQNYEAVADWVKLPEGRDKIGNMHGDVAVSSADEVYVSVQGGPKAGVQVYSAAGKYLRNVPGAPKVGRSSGFASCSLCKLG